MCNRLQFFYPGRSPTFTSLYKTRMLSKILAAFNVDPPYEMEPFGPGLINHTWKVNARQKEYILQRINHHVFQKPQSISDNIRLIGNYLSVHHPEYLFTLPVKTVSGDDLFYDEQEGYFRLFPFIKGSHTIDVVRSAEQAHAAAVEFGTFTGLLDSFPVNALKTTIPDFHNLSLRYSNFQKALSDGIEQRIIHASEEIKFIRSQDHIVKQYKDITQNPQFKTRVTHHDTKISNVLFDDKGTGLCVIDLDTVMPGYFISDVGDMMRTYLCPVSEEETDLQKIGIREDFYKAIVNGYREQMNDKLTDAEKHHFMYAGQFMIYMQALRFLTDYLYGDIYYGSKYPGHNLERSKNQLVLFKKLTELKHLDKVIS